MKALIKKEFLEQKKLAVITSTFFATLIAFMLFVGTQRSVVSEGFLFVIAFIFPLLGIALAVSQFYFESKKDSWLFLLHRPLESEKIFSGKVRAGLILYLGITLIPFFLILWISRFERFAHTPFTWHQIIPTLVISFTGILYYMSTIIVVLRKASWWGSKVFPFIVPFFASFFTFHSISFWPVILFHTGSILVLFIVSRSYFNAFRNDKNLGGIAMASLTVIMLAACQFILLFVIPFSANFIDNNKTKLVFCNYIADKDTGDLFSFVRRKVKHKESLQIYNSQDKKEILSHKFSTVRQHDLQHQALKLTGLRIKNFWKKYYSKSLHYWEQVAVVRVNSKEFQFYISYPEKMLYRYQKDLNTGKTHWEQMESFARFGDKIIKINSFQKNCIVLDKNILQIDDYKSGRLKSTFKAQDDEHILNTQKFYLLEKDKNKAPWGCASVVETTKRFYFLDDDNQIKGVFFRGRPQKNVNSTYFSIEKDLPYYYVLYEEGYNRDPYIDIIDKTSGKWLATKQLKAFSSPSNNYIWPMDFVIPLGSYFFIRIFENAFGQNSDFSFVSGQSSFHLAVVCLLALLFCFLIVRRNRERNIKGSTLISWIFLALVFGPVAFLAHLYIYPPLVRETCGHCKHMTRVDAENCQYCQSPFSSPASDGTEIFET
jgi:hypothetical protein